MSLLPPETLVPVAPPHALLVLSWAALHGADHGHRLPVQVGHLLLHSGPASILKLGTQ